MGSAHSALLTPQIQTSVTYYSNNASKISVKCIPGFVFLQFYYL